MTDRDPTSKTKLDQAWDEFIRNTPSNRSVWEAFKFAWEAASIPAPETAVRHKFNCNKNLPCDCGAESSKEQAPRRSQHD